MNSPKDTTKKKHPHEKTQQHVNKRLTKPIDKVLYSGMEKEDHFTNKVGLPLFRVNFAPARAGVVGNRKRKASGLFLVRLFQFLKGCDYDFGHYVRLG